MKKIKIEYTAFDYKTFTPNKVFFKELSSQLTPKVAELVTDDVLRENLADLICLSVDQHFYLTPSFTDGINSMKMNIAAKSAPLIICDFVVSWHTESKFQINPWDECGGISLSFDLLVGRRESSTLRETLPKLYHPLIKANVSGLSFDYQIFYGGESLVLSTHNTFFQKDVDVIERTFNDFYQNYALSHGFDSDFCEIKVSGKKLIKIHVDSDKWTSETIESAIRCFDGIDVIKKITFR